MLGGVMARANWQVSPGSTIELGELDAASTAHSPGDRAATDAVIPGMHEVLRGLQNRLWAEGARSVLVVLQGIDASGKDGTISHVFRGLDPLGTSVAVFKVPNDQELAHDFLWRVHARCPAAGEIGIFNRSHYEDVLAARVRHLVSEATWHARYGHINEFESLLGDEGTTVVKLFLHVSKKEQRKRLDERLTDPTKRWKFRESDLVDRAQWTAYRAAFEEMLAKTSTTTAPWYVVPADHKWYRNWVVSTILIEVLTEMDPRYPTVG
jgi:PPK2 family polyphosphate:nucleotide phosphotransferase